MKKMYAALLSLFILLAGCGVTSSGTGGDKKTAKNEKRAGEYEKTAALIEGGNYIYKVQSVSPAGGKTISTTTPYSMKASEGIYEAYLPYFGRAYQSNMGGSGGIEFKGEPEELKITKKPEKFTLTVTFKISAANERYDVAFLVGSNGYGTLTIGSRNRQTISYYGQAAALTEE